MRFRKKLIRWLLVASVLAVAVAFAARAAPVVELLELMIYDRATAKRGGSSAEGSPVVKVVFTEEYLNGKEIAGEPWQHPISDENLASILSRLLDAGATAVGVDIWRGIPQPVGNEDESLDLLLSEHAESSRIFWIFDPDFPPSVREAPAGLEGDLSRAVLSDFVADSGMSPRFRRGLLMEGDEGLVTSLGMGVAMKYLAENGVPIEWGEEFYDAHTLGEAKILAFRGDDGGYRDQDDGGIQVMLTFPQRSFPTVDFAWVMESPIEELEQFVSGKIVLVGVTADTVKDSSATPISEKMRGLDIHASFASQIVGAAQGNWPITVSGISDTLEVSILVFATILGVFVGGFSRRILWAGGTVVALAFALVAFGGWLVQNYFWMPVVSPSVALLVGFGFAAAVAWKLERSRLREMSDVMLTTLGKEQVELIFGKVEELLKDGKIKAQPSHATLMMTDLKNFAMLTEALGPDRLHDWLDRYMKLMSTTVKQHGGFVKAYIGDAIYAVFGLGQRGESAREPARQALLCGLAMRAALEELNAELREEGAPKIGMRVGINSGPVSVGSMGSRGAMEYAILGDSVNTAARLESYDKSVEPKAVCRIIGSESTLGLAGEQNFDTGSLGGLELKGKARPVGASLIFSAIETGEIRLLLDRTKNPNIMNPSLTSRRTSLWLVALVTCIGVGIGFFSCSSAAGDEKEPAIQLPKFKTPPGKPKRKGTHGTRTDKDPVRVALLTPETFGAAYSTQPALFWYQSDSSEAKKIIFSIREEGSSKHLVRHLLPAAYKKGINRLDLAKMKVKLREGKTYQWSITYVISRNRPSLNGVGSGVIKVQAPPTSAASALKSASVEEKAAIYARGGAWHDLLEALDTLAKSKPKEAAAKASFNALLKDVGLGDMVD